MLRPKEVKIIYLLQNVLLYILEDLYLKLNMDVYILEDKIYNGHMIHHLHYNISTKFNQIK